MTGMGRSVIAVDSSTMIDWLRGRSTPQTEALESAMDDDALYLPPPVEAELLSFPGAQPGLAVMLNGLPRLEVRDGFWSRAGLTRRTVLAKGLKANLPDALIAQFCLDADATLIATDRDFRHFATHCGLKLAI